MKKLVLSSIIIFFACCVYQVSQASGTVQSTFGDVDYFLGYEWDNRELLIGGKSEALLERVWDNNVHDSYVIRHISKRPYDGRVIEVQGQTAASDEGYGPHLYAYDLEKGIIVMEFLHEIKDKKADPCALACVVKKMHDGTSVLPTNVATYVDHIEKKFTDTNVYIDDVYKSVCLNKLKNMATFYDYTVQKKRAHNDLHEKNIIVTKDDVFLIDFASSSMDDPFYDLAKIVVLYFTHDVQAEEQFLQAYFERALTVEEQRHLYAMKKCVYMRWAFGRLKEMPAHVLREDTGEIEVFDVLLEKHKNGVLDLSNPKDMFRLIKSILHWFLEY